MEDPWNFVASYSRPVADADEGVRRKFATG
jgi:hypothetical protein